MFFSKIAYFPLLKKVARSFYLTLRFLPGSLQEPISLAYLLARASDTIADSGSFSLEQRRGLLKNWAYFLQWNEKEAWLQHCSLQEELFLTRLEGAEKELLLAFPLLLNQFFSPQRPSWEYEAIRLVWQQILEGQCSDIFQDHSYTEAVFQEALDHYLYQVAGSVGEFWTILAAHEGYYFAQEAVPKMIQWGISYGKGLQLINILRDRLEDAAQGRIYCNASQVPLFLELAGHYLAQGESYVKALSPGRFKYASFLPLLIAQKTRLLLLEKPFKKNIKITRRALYGILFRALPTLFL